MVSGTSIAQITVTGLHTVGRGRGSSGLFSRHQCTPWQFGPPASSSHEAEFAGYSAGGLRATAVTSIGVRAVLE